MKTKKNVIFSWMAVISGVMIWGVSLSQHKNHSSGFTGYDTGFLEACNCCNLLVYYDAHYRTKNATKSKRPANAFWNGVFRNYSIFLV